MNNLRFLSKTELNSATLDRQTFAQPALSFEVASQLITVRVPDSPAAAAIRKP